MFKIKKLVWACFILAIANNTPADAAETLGAKLRRLAAGAELSNPQINPPLRPAQVWIANKAYVAGEAVRNGENLYLCYIGGVSSAAVGPTGTGFANIVDGTATWEYLGPSLVNKPDPSAPTVTSVNSLASVNLTKSYFPLINSSAFSFGGGVPTPQPGAPSIWASFPAVHSTVSGTSGNIGFNNGTESYFWSASFVTDAPVVAINVSWGAEPANIIIDGRKLSPGGIKGLAGASWFLLDFTNAGGRRQRTITLEDYGNIRFGGVSVDAASTVSAPVLPDKVRVAFLGSSIEAGGNSFPVLGSPSWPVQAARLLGWSDPWNLGIGGTGYINNNQGLYFNYIGHVNDAINIAPDVVVVGGPINDESYPSLQLTSAAAALFNKLRSGLPNTPIIAMGTFPASRGLDAQSVNSELAIQSVVAKLNDPNLFFIPLISGPGGAVITGKGRVSSPLGDGNADFYISSDGTHPTQLGINYEAAQYTAAIKSIFVNKIP